MSVSAVPTHRVVLSGVMPVTVGSAFTVTAVDAAGKLVQPAPGYVAVTEYTPLSAVAEATKPVFEVAVVARKEFGPDQLNDVRAPVPVVPTAVNVSTAPGHKSVDDVFTEAMVGSGFTLNDTVLLAGTAPQVNEFWRLVMVTVVEPVPVSEPEGTLNVPVPAANVSVADKPVAVVPPERS